MENYRTKHSGPNIDLAIDIGLNIDQSSNGWLKVVSTATEPVDLDTLIASGNYTFSFFINGDASFNGYSPLNFCVTNIGGVLTQFAIVPKFLISREYDSLGEVWGEWVSTRTSRYIYIQSETPVTTELNALWIDTTDPALYLFKIYTATGWKEISPSGMMATSVYDTENLATDFYAYVDDAITTALGVGESNAVAILIAHIADNVKHVTQLEKDAWSAKIGTTTAANDIAAMKVEAIEYTDSKVLALTTTTGTLSGNIDSLTTLLNSHINDTAIHLSAEQVALWNSKASGTHTHYSDDRVRVDASAVVSGIISIDRIPAGAKERVKEVVSDAARFALTVTDVQLGDLVYVNTGTTKHFYVVVDETKLGIAAGYLLYSAGVAQGVEWTSILNKPTTVVGFGINDAYTTTEVLSLITDYLNAGKTYTDEQIALLLGGCEALSFATYDIGEVANWQALCYGNGLFVAIVNNSNIIATSPDGVHWTRRTAPASTVWDSVSYGNGVFVAISYSMSITMTSVDGVTWTQRALPQSLIWDSICYGAGGFVIIASDSTVILTSPDGITWTERLAPSAAPWEWVCYGNGMYVAVSYNSNAIMTSPDGITWTGRTAPQSARWTSVCYGGGVFVAVAWNTVAMTSPDGINWTTRVLPSSLEWTSVSYGNGTFAAISRTSNIVATSPDGITWTERNIQTTASWGVICFGNGRFIAIAANTSYVLNFIYNKGSLNNLLSAHQTELSETDYFISESLFINGVALKDIISANTIKVNSNADSIIALNASIVDINDGLADAEALSADILALVQ